MYKNEVFGLFDAINDQISVINGIILQNDSIKDLLNLTKYIEQDIFEAKNRLAALFAQDIDFDDDKLYGYTSDIMDHLSKFEKQLNRKRKEYVGLVDAAETCVSLIEENKEGIIKEVNELIVKNEIRLNKIYSENMANDLSDMLFKLKEVYKGNECTKEKAIQTYESILNIANKQLKDMHPCDSKKQLFSTLEQFGRELGHSSEVQKERQ